MKGKIEIVKDGPYLVSGDLPLATEIIVRDDGGFAVDYEKGGVIETAAEYSLCRCGNTQNAPFCDGSHFLSGFQGEETASRQDYIDEAESLNGPGLDLTDNVVLCASAGFCHNSKGEIWDLTRQSDDQEARDLAIREACHCPSGRLVAWDKETGEAIDPDLPPSISLIEDPANDSSGPIWVKGNVDIVSADGKLYERRNRVTLCRCGESRNKPFCDGTHVDIGFHDEGLSLRKKGKT
ncbi:MAG: CDGSH iron-sulfur domain-containing protein [Dehalococcoidia bacterium]|nr:CDGSH iron-sulfur domain-containing protein [Dehalococcoidia bacterium]